MQLSNIEIIDHGYVGMAHTMVSLVSSSFPVARPSTTSVATMH
jgi:hypothetical protein